MPSTASLPVYSRLSSGPMPELREEVQRLEDLGVTGVVISDHLFGTAPGQRRQASRPPEPMTLLAAVAALSDRLHVGTIVANAGLLHPALLLRQFAQIAVMIGGERVLAGIGAGWNRPEFEALGMRMPKFEERMERLEEAAALARQLFDQGHATLHGEQVVADDLPLAPLPEVPPRLMLGGGSRRILEIAGRYADALDLNGSPVAGKVSGTDLQNADKRRRLLTNVTDLEASAAIVRDTSTASGRAPDAVSFSILLSTIVFCTEAEVRRHEEEICAGVGLPPRSLDDSAYVAIGPPERIAALVQERRQRLGLSRLFVSSPEIGRFCREVVPLLED